MTWKRSIAPGESIQALYNAHRAYKLKEDGSYFIMKNRGEKRFGQATTEEIVQDLCSDNKVLILSLQDTVLASNFSL